MLCLRFDQPVVVALRGHRSLLALPVFGAGVLAAHPFGHVGLHKRPQLRDVHHDLPPLRRGGYYVLDQLELSFLQSD